MKITAIVSVICCLMLIGCNENLSETFDENSVSESSSIIDGNWILESSFSDDTLFFKRINQIDTNQQWLKQFTFEPNDVKFEYIRNTPRCGNGIISIDSTGCKINNSTIDLYLKGRSVDFKFASFNNYKIIESLKNGLILIKQKEMLNEYEQTNVILIK
ncbi:MAG: hypothetical protein HRT58_21080 [Crocinitomicaceae bacterium]|nr:hypothetical protein [Flavobacteriales bacterium]NQZ38166.1 hypothetical protein [Crocinitomicaceae bacterium]